MVEVKNKQTITLTDIQKFKDDAQQYDFSIFVSLIAPKMHEYNDFYFDQQNNHIYLSQQYINQQIFTFIKLLLSKIFMQPTSETLTKIEQNMKIIKIF